MLPAAVAVLGLLTVGLAGCSLPGSDDCPRPLSSASSVTDLVSVSDDLDAAAEPAVYTPFHTESTATDDVVVGDGNTLTTDEQLVVMDLEIVGGNTGETVYAGSLEPAFQLSQLGQAIPAITDALECATEGSRVVVALAPGDIEAETATGMGLRDDESAVAVVDLREVYLARANGAPVISSGNGLPTVVLAPSGQPGIIIPDAPVPTETTVQVLKRGDGPVVTGEVPVRVHYTGVTWAERTVFDSSWGAAPASLTLDGVVPGFAEALEGQTVGSQVMVVIPPKDGYGDQAQGAIPADSTLVFVIDILGLDPAAEQ